MTDLSDTLALFGCCRITLSDLDPSGEWMANPLYLRYISQPYGGLTHGEIAELLIDLQGDIAALTPAHYKRWWKANADRT